MSTKHAPGPWRYDRDNLNVYANGLLAQTFGHTHNGEREANARLIATSPELLIELQTAERTIKAMIEHLKLHNTVWNDSFADDLKTELAAVRLTIAKATGGTP